MLLVAHKIYRFINLFSLISNRQFLRLLFAFSAFLGKTSLLKLIENTTHLVVGKGCITKKESMGSRCAKFISNFDANEVFSYVLSVLCLCLVYLFTFVCRYSTVKFVVIKDKRLGIIHHVLQAGIFVYILLYTILYEQRYLLYAQLNKSYFLLLKNIID